MTNLPSWARGPLDEHAYGDYLRHHAQAAVTPRATSYLTDDQHRRLDALARKVLELGSTTGDLASGYHWLGCSVSTSLLKSWSAYERLESCEPQNWLVWCYVRDGRELHLAIPAEAEKTTAENVAAACDVIARLSLCDGLADAVKAWVLKGDVG